ncbi:phage holin family protein [Patescibacteria group bacterium]
MRDFIRKILLNTFTLFAVSSFFAGLIVPSQLDQLLWAAAIFTLINQLAKPIVKLLLLPFNLLTLGIFRWVSNVFVLMIITRFIPTIAITSFISPAINKAGFSIPAISISLVFSYILASLFLSLIYNFLDNFLADE